MSLDSYLINKRHLLEQYKSQIWRKAIDIRHPPNIVFRNSVPFQMSFWFVEIYVRQDFE